MSGLRHRFQINCGGHPEHTTVFYFVIVCNFFGIISRCMKTIRAYVVHKSDFIPSDHKPQINYLQSFQSPRL